MNDPTVNNRLIYVGNRRLFQAATISEGIQKDNSVLLAADKALKDVLATPLTERKNNRTADNEPISVPLREPTAEALEQLSSGGQLTLLLGRLATLMGDNSVSQLTSRLENYLAMMASQQRQGELLSEAFQAAFEQAQSAMDTCESALDNLKTAQTAYNNSVKKLELAETKLNELTPDSPDYEVLKQQIGTLQNELSVHRNNLETALSATETANNSAREQTEKLDNIASRIQGNILTSNQTRQYQTDNLNSIARFTMLLSIFIELVGKNNEESLKNDMALFRTLQESRQKEMLKKSEEYLAETQKAEELNRTMGCVGKVLGALVTVASVVAAVFTGGAALVLAAVSLALILADEIVKASTGISFIQQALNPVIQHVLKPLMDIIGKVISDVLKGLGMNSATAEMVGNILGAVVAAVAMVVVIVGVAVLGKGAVAKLGDVLGRMMNEMVKKLLPDVLKQVMQNGSRVLTQGVQRLAGVSGRQSIILNKMALGMTGGNVIAQSGGAIAEGVFLKKASDAYASFSMALFSGEQIRMWLKEAVEKFGDNNNITQELQKTLSSVIQQHSDTSRSVLRQIRA